MAVRAAATKAQAPYSRVRGRLKGHEPTGTRGGANSNLSAEQETLVVNYIEVLDGIGLNPSTEMVKQAANHLLRIEFDALDLSQFQRSAHKAVKVVAEPKKVDPHWFGRFLKRHPQTMKRWEKILARRKESHREAIKAHFDRVGAWVKELHIKERDIWDFDETGWHIGVRNKQEVVCLQGRHGREISSRSYPDNRERLTEINSISAGGRHVPPMFIVEGELALYDWSTLVNDKESGLLTLDCPENARWCQNDSGHMDEDVMLVFLRHFDAYSQPEKPGDWRMLLTDGQSARITYEVISFALENHIQLIQFPSHNTQLLQPLDVGCFQPLKQYGSQAISKNMLSGSAKFNKMDYFRAIRNVHKKTFEPETIVSAFQKAGLVPLDADKVLERLPEPEAEEDGIGLEQPTLSPPPTHSKDT